MGRPQNLLILLSTSSPYRITQTWWMREPLTKNSDVDYFVHSFCFDFLNKSNHCQYEGQLNRVMVKLHRKVELHINLANFLNIFPLPSYNTINYHTTNNTNILNIVHCIVHHGKLESSQIGAIMVVVESQANVLVK